MFSEARAEADFFDCGSDGGDAITEADLVGVDCGSIDPTLLNMGLGVHSDPRRLVGDPGVYSDGDDDLELGRGCGKRL